MGSEGAIAALCMIGRSGSEQSFACLALVTKLRTFRSLASVYAMAALRATSGTHFQSDAWFRGLDNGFNRLLGDTRAATSLSNA